MPVALDLVRTALGDPRFHETSPANQLRYRDTILIPALRSDPLFLALPPDQQQGFIDREINQKLAPLTSGVEQVTQEPVVPSEGPGLIPRAAGVAGRVVGAVTGPFLRDTATVVNQLMRPAYGGANVAKHLTTLHSPAPGEPGRTFGEVAKEDFGKPFLRGLKLEETTGGPEVGLLLAKRLRGELGLPEAVPGSTAETASKVAAGIGGLALDIINPAASGVFKGLGMAGKALAKSGPVVRGMEAAKAAMPDVFKVRYGADPAYQKLADFTETTIHNRTEDVIKQGVKMVDELTPEERLRAAVLMQSPELRAGMHATVGDARDVAAAVQARDAEVFARAAFAHKGPPGTAPPAQLSSARYPSGKLVEAENQLLRYRKSPQPGDAAILNHVNPARAALDALTKEVQRDYLAAGFVGPAKAEELTQILENNLGKYVPRMYTIFEQKAPLARPPGSDLAQLLPRTDAQLKAISLLDNDAAKELADLMHWAAERAQNPSFASKLMGIPAAVLARRTNPTEVYRTAIGAIEDLAYPYVKRSAQLIRTVETARFFTTISENPAWFSGVRKAGFRQMPETLNRYGPLAGKWVQDNIARDILSTTDPLMQSQLMQTWMKGLGAWKYGKVVLNPGTQSRNLWSNLLLSDFSGVDVTQQPAYLIRAIREMKRGGRGYVDLRNAGGLGREYVGGELDGMLRSVESLAPGESILSLAFTPVRAAAAGAGTIYQKTEQAFKLARFLWARDQGQTVAEAAAGSETWLFNYSKVSPALKLIRQLPLGSPFVTFSAKVLPRIIETAIKEPWRIAKYQILFNSLENETKRRYGLTDRELARLKSSNPGYAIVLPVKDAQGNFYVLDLSYLLPWGNIMEMGTVTPFLPAAFSVGGPAVTALEAASGIDFYKKKLGMPHEFREVNKGLPTGFTPAQATVNQVVRGLLPALTPGIPGVTGPGVEPAAAVNPKSFGQRLGEAVARSGGFGAQKLAAALSGLPDRMGRVRGRALTALDVLGGIKISPVDAEAKRVQEIRRYLNQRGSRVNEQGDMVPGQGGLQEELFRIATDRSLSPAAKQRLTKIILEQIAELDATRPGQRR